MDKLDEREAATRSPLAAAPALAVQFFLIPLAVVGLTVTVYVGFRSLLHPIIQLGVVLVLVTAVVLTAIVWSRSRGSAPLPTWRICSRMPASTGVSLFRHPEKKGRRQRAKRRKQDPAFCLLPSALSSTGRIGAGAGT